MAGLRELWMRLVAVVCRDAVERDFEDELAAHVQLATDESLRQGMDKSEAKRQALIKLGGMEPSREAHREARGLPGLDGMIQDVRYAWRSLRRTPSFVATAVAMLGLTIGVNTAAFTVMQAVLFRGFTGVPDNHRLLYVTGPRGEGDLSYPDFDDWRQQATVFAGMGAVADLKVALSDAAGTVEKADVTTITTDGFQVLGVRPLLGRVFVPQDRQTGKPTVAILSYAFWERRYGRDPGIVGQTVQLDRSSTTIIGVMPRGFSFPQKVDLWVPPAITPETEKREARGVWFAFGRLRDGETRERAAEQMGVIAKRLARAYPASNIDAPPHVLGFEELFIGPQASLMYWALFGAVTLVLLIACANMANLMLSRAIARGGEVALRMAMGASRWRVVRQFLIESLSVAVLGGLVGWWVAVQTVRAYQRLAPPPDWFAGVLDYTIDARVLAYLALVCVATGLLFGVVPALRLSRLQAVPVLKDNGRAAAGSIRTKRLSGILVAFEMALAIVLLAGAGVMLRSFANIYGTKLGVETDNVLMAFINLPIARYPDVVAQQTFFGRLSERLSLMPGAERVAIASAYPTGGAPGRLFDIADVPSLYAPGDQRRPRAGVVTIGVGYFETVGAALSAGRVFAAADVPDGQKVVIVNEQFAAQQWPGQDPLGKRLRLLTPRGPGEWRTVVGLAPNIVQNFLDPRQIEPLLYLPHTQDPSEAMWMIIRTAVPPSTLGPALTRDVQALDVQLPVWLGPFALSDRLGRAYAERALYGVLLMILAVVAVLLAAAGLYAVTAQAVRQRTREIGIRVALGAPAKEVLHLMLWQSLLPLAGGLVVGLLASMSVNRVLTSVLVQVSPGDPATLMGAAGLLLVIGICGCAVPIGRALRLEPLVVLRNE